MIFTVSMLEECRENSTLILRFFCICVFYLLRLDFVGVHFASDIIYIQIDVSFKLVITKKVRLDTAYHLSWASMRGRGQSLANKSKHPNVGAGLN